MNLRYKCAGTLINAQTITTAAHCAKTNIVIDNVTVNLQYNVVYPTWESTFSVFLGVQNTDFIDQGLTPPALVQTPKISKIIRVKK